MTKNQEFWKKVENCKHENADDTGYILRCPTPYCSGSEIHCKECGVFITECGCGFMNGMSGWSLARMIKHKKRK